MPMLLKWDKTNQLYSRKKNNEFDVCLWDTGTPIPLVSLSVNGSDAAHFTADQLERFAIDLKVLSRRVRLYASIAPMEGEDAT